MHDTHFFDGAVVIYQRNRSSIWQARIKIGSGSKGWKRFSTHTTDASEAGKFACDKYHEFRVMAKYGLSPDSRTFKYCAEIAEKEMRIALESNTGKVIYHDYIRTLYKYLIPFFGSSRIDSITYNQIIDFNQYRIKKLGRIPAKSTVNNHNATLKRVFNVALKNNWLKREAIPILNTETVETRTIEIRSHFTDDELNRLLKFLKTWRNTGRKEITRQIRTLLYDYVYLIAYTGIRPGTEADHIRFSDIGVFTNNSKKKYLSIRVNGKTGEREISADRTVKNAINRIISRHHAFKKEKGWNDLDNEFFDPFQNNSLIFELECTKDIPKDLGRSFKKALTECNMLFDRHNKPRTLYSLRHTFATRILIKNELNIHLLARHMGTSVAMIEKYYSHVTSMSKADRVTLTDSLESEFNQKHNTKNHVDRLKYIGKNKPKNL